MAQQLPRPKLWHWNLIYSTSHSIFPLRPSKSLLFPVLPIFISPPPSHFIVSPPAFFCFLSLPLTRPNCHRTCWWKSMCFLIVGQSRVDTQVYSRYIGLCPLRISGFFMQRFPHSFSLDKKKMENHINVLIWCWDGKVGAPMTADSNRYRPESCSNWTKETPLTLTNTWFLFLDEKSTIDTLSWVEWLCSRCKYSSALMETWHCGGHNFLRFGVEYRCSGSWGLWLKRPLTR